jgi:hypothetical protein
MVNTRRSQRAAAAQASTEAPNARSGAGDGVAGEEGSARGAVADTKARAARLAAAKEQAAAEAEAHSALPGTQGAAQSATGSRGYPIGEMPSRANA